MGKSLIKGDGWRAGVILCLIVGVMFTTIGILISQGIISGGTCEYFCVFGTCLIPAHECTESDISFWKYGIFSIGIVCLIIAAVVPAQKFLHNTFKRP